MLSEEFSRIIEANQSGLAAIEGNLLSSAQGAKVKSLFITSSRPGEGKTTAAVMLAHALATTTPDSVVIVDGNFAKPRIHEAFQLKPDAPGFGDVLTGKASLEQVIQKTGIDRLSAITAGKHENKSLQAGIIPAAACQEQLQKLGAQFNYVIFDGDSVFTSSNSAVLSRYFDGVALVAECERTKWEVVDLARQKIVGVGGRVIGVILSKRNYYIPSGLHEKL
jgi:capsular exopolysaccharide synthesis family protein